MIDFRSFFLKETSDPRLGVRDVTAPRISNTELEHKLLVIFPGRFQPFHKGHAKTYNSLCKRFTQGEVFIATSNVVNEKSPFSFKEKLSIIEFFGIPGHRVVQVSDPYKAIEITKKYNPDSTSLIFALSQKDSDRFSYGKKKDGSAAYLKRYEDVNGSNHLLDPFARHGYITVECVEQFKVQGKTVISASEIREMYKVGSDQQRKQIIIDLYGKFSENIYKLFNSKLIT